MTEFWGRKQFFCVTYVFYRHHSEECQSERIKSNKVISVQYAVCSTSDVHPTSRHPSTLLLPELAQVYREMRKTTVSLGLLLFCIIFAPTDGFVGACDGTTSRSRYVTSNEFDFILRLETDVGSLSIFCICSSFPDADSW